MYSPTVVRSRGPMLAELDEAQRRMYYRRCDTAARHWLLDMIMPEFDAGNLEGSSMLVHAERYLADRLAYELGPLPKGMIRLETAQDYAMPELKMHLLTKDRNKVAAQRAVCERRMSDEGGRRVRRRE